MANDKVARSEYRCFEEVHVDLIELAVTALDGQAHAVLFAQANAELVEPVHAELAELVDAELIGPANVGLFGWEYAELFELADVALGEQVPDAVLGQKCVESDVAGGAVDVVEVDGSNDSSSAFVKQLV